MADKDIKQRIVLEGEKEYNSALKEAQRNLKVLRSELKAESAELGKNATEQQKNEAKLKNLAKQIKEQEKVVKTYEKALAEVKEKYGDNGDAVAKWEIKLNDARTALANMKSGLDDVGNGLKQTNADLNTGVTAANSLADSFSKIGDIGGNVSEALEGIFTSMVDTISQTVSAIWTQLTEVAAKADKYSDTAAFLGSSPAEVQKWSKAMESAGGSLDTVVNLITRLRYGGKDKKVAEWFGISAVNYDDDLKYFEAVLSAMNASKDAMKSAGTWSTAMSDIFGAKKVQDVDSILSDWPEILAGLTKYDVDQGGFGLSDEQIKKMNTFYNTVNNLKTSWESLKEMAVVELFGDLALNITGNLQNIVDAFKDYFSAEDQAGRDKALETIKENIKAIFKQVKDAIQDGLKILNELADELKNSDDSTLQVLGSLLETITNGLEWFTKPENWETVKKGFEAIIGVWATGKIVSAISHMAAFGSHLTTISKFFGGGSGGNKTTGTGTDIVPTGGTGTTSGGGWFTKALEGLSNGLGVTGAFRADAIVRSMFKEEMAGLTVEEQQAKALMHDLGVTQEELEAFSDPMSWTGRGHSFEVETSEPFTDSMIEAAEAFWDAWRDDGDFTDEEYEAYASAFEGFPDLLEKMDRLFTQLTDEFDYGDEGWTNMKDLPADWWTNQNNLTSEDISGFRVLPNNIASAVRNGVSNIRVTMDGQAVGRLVAPYVSEQIARDMV